MPRSAEMGAVGLLLLVAVGLLCPAAATGAKGRCSTAKLPSLVGTGAYIGACKSGSKMLKEGAWCMSRCAKGFKPSVGDMAPRCQCKDGQWTNMAGSCTPVANITIEPYYWTLEGPCQIVDMFNSYYKAGKLVDMANVKAKDFTTYLSSKYTYGFLRGCLADLKVKTATVVRYEQNTTHNETCEGIFTYPDDLKTCSITVEFDMDSSKMCIPSQYMKKAIIRKALNSRKATPAIASMAVDVAHKDGLDLHNHLNYACTCMSDKNGTCTSTPSKAVRGSVAFGESDASAAAPSSTNLCGPAVKLTASMPFSVADTDVPPTFTAAVIDAAAEMSLNADCTVSVTAGTGGAAGTAAATCVKAEDAFDAGEYTILFTASFRSNKVQSRSFGTVSVKVPSC